MKKLAISILCLSLSLSVFAGKQNAQEEETPKLPKGAVIEEDLRMEKSNQVSTYKIYGSLKGMDKTKADKIRLQGKVYISPCKDKSLKGYNITNIQWLGVQKVDAPDKVVGFKEPIVSSFMFKSGTDIKNIPLPTFGDQQDLIRAISDLEQDKIDLEDLKRKRKFKAVHGKQDKNAYLVVSKKGTGKSKVTSDVLKETISGEGSEMSINDKDMVNGSTDKSSSEGNQAGSSGNSASFGSNYGAGDYHNLPGFQSNDGTSSRKERGIPANSQPEHTSNNDRVSPVENNNSRDTTSSNTQFDNPSNRDNSSPLDDNNSRGRTTENNPSERTIYRNASNYDLYRLDRIDEDNPPNIEGDAVVVARDGQGRQRVYFVRNGRFVRNRDGGLASREVNVNADNLAVDENGRVIRNDENREYVENLINELMFDFNRNIDTQEDEPIDFGPEVRIELTEDGCNPEHDVLQERVIITSRTKKYENNQLVDEGVCERTLESYPVKRDYLCEECVDEVDLEGKRAFARYQEHWFDKEGVRHNLDIKINEGEPFQIFEEAKGCGFDINEDETFAIEKRRLGYLNKFRVFKTVENCRVTEQSSRFPVTSTTKDCPVIHNFIDNVSHEQRKLVFNKNGREFEAKACHVFGPAIPHDFITEGCPAITNPLDNSVTQTFKRKIVLSLRFLDRQSQFQHQTITDYCELPGDTTLSSEWCPGEYVHDIILGRSYLNKRYYYLAGQDKRYVTPLIHCLRTNDYVPHQTEPTDEWENNDQKKCSYPKIKHFFDAPEPINERKIIGIKADPDSKEDYVLVENIQRPTGEHYYHGCFKRTKTNSINIFRRPDGSAFEENLGVGEPIVSDVNECTETHEERTQDNVRQQRTVTTYPDGRREYGQWVRQ